MHKRDLESVIRSRWPWPSRTVLAIFVTAIISVSALLFVRVVGSSPAVTPTPPTPLMSTDYLTPRRTTKPNQPVTSTATVGTCPKAGTNDEQPVPILEYHELGDGPNDLYVAVADFERQMQFLAQAGYVPVTLDATWRHFTYGDRISPCPVIITFDDGYQSFYARALPVLRAHHFPAALFVITRAVGHDNYVTWSEILEMDREGFEIGAHTHTHSNLASLDRSRVSDEIGRSKAILEEQLGHPVWFFAYPHGKYNDTVLNTVRQSGFRAAVTVRFGAASADQNPFEWKRVNVFRGETITQFERRLQDAVHGAPKLVRKLRQGRPRLPIDSRVGIEAF